uniref:Uncharacterized protein n=1 Tax=Arundo donax TaxID=35708 RepID=A0A0A9B9F1_ARUDO
MKTGAERKNGKETKWQCLMKPNASSKHEHGRKMVWCFLT